MEKFEIIALKKLKAVLTEKNCQKIQIFPKDDIEYVVNGQLLTLHGVYVVSFIIANGLKINLFIRFNKSESLFYIPNNDHSDLAVYLKETKDLVKIKEYLATIPEINERVLANLGFLPISPRPHSKFIKFLSTLNQREINMTVEILKHENLSKQLTSHYTYDYYDSFPNFIIELIENIV